MEAFRLYVDSTNFGFAITPSVQCKLKGKLKQVQETIFFPRTGKPARNAGTTSLVPVEACQTEGSEDFHPQHSLKQSSPPTRVIQAVC